MVKAFSEGDLKTATNFQRFMRDATSVVDKYGGLSAAKVLENQRVPCGGCRNPLVNLTPEKKDEFLKEIQPFDKFLSAGTLPENYNE